MRSDLVEVECHLHHEIKAGSKDEGALFVSLDGSRAKAVWLPKSRTEVEHKGRGVVVLTMRESLAIEKGLV